VLIAVADLETAAREIEAEYGLASIEGGHHPAWGTANRIVPLGETYLELVTVVDAARAATSGFGSWIAGAEGDAVRPTGWAVRTRNLDAVAGRLGLEVVEGSRMSSVGELLHWKIAGVEEAAAEPCLPFFIEWGIDTPFPGRATIAHPVGHVAISRLEFEGDLDRLTAWLGSDGIPAVARVGRLAVSRVVLTGGVDEFHLGG
jgi:hypothetical protein